MSLSAFAVAFHAVESVEKCTTGSVAKAAVITTLNVSRIRPRNSDTVQAWPGPQTPQIAGLKKMRLMRAHNRNVTLCV